MTSPHEPKTETVRIGLPIPGVGKSPDQKVKETVRIQLPVREPQVTPPSFSPQLSASVMPAPDSPSLGPKKETTRAKPVIADCRADWCVPCKMIAPLLDEIAREKVDTLKVAKVNVYEAQSLSFRYNRRAIPALLFFKNGQLRDQVTGSTSKQD